MSDTPEFSDTEILDELERMAQTAGGFFALPSVEGYVGLRIGRKDDYTMAPSLRAFIISDRLSNDPERKVREFERELINYFVADSGGGHPAMRRARLVSLYREALKGR